MSERISELFFCQPWAIKSDMLNIISGIVEKHVNGEKLSNLEIDARIDSDKKAKGSYEVKNGTAVIPIYGVISKRASFFSRVSQCGSSVVEIKENIDFALQDPKVHRILLDVDSPGGSVGGVPELSDYIFSVRGSKEIIAYANGMMASAAYWIASSADKIYTSKSSLVGSIGVYSVLRDLSVMEHNSGIKTEIIKAGKYKAAGHQSKPLTEDERLSLQEEIDAFYDMFVEGIARNRNMSIDEVIKFADGRVYIGAKSKELRLVDDVKTFDSVLSANDKIYAITNQNEHIGEDNSMGELNLKDATKEQLKAENPTLVKAIEDEAMEVGQALGVETGKAEGIASERARVTAIIQDAQDNEFLGFLGTKDGIKAINDGLGVTDTKVLIRDGKLVEIKDSTPESVGANPDVEAETGDKPKTFQAAWEAHKKETNCSTEEAICWASENHPDLHKESLKKS